MTNLAIFFEKVLSVFSTFSWKSDVLDILLLTFLFYSVLKIIRDSRAYTFAKGIVVLALLYLVVTILNMQASAYIFSTVFNNILLILIVIFAPEIRKLLESMGTSKALTPLKVVFSSSNHQKIVAYNEQVANAVNEICRAVEDMSDKKIGALMVFEKDTPLGEIAETGTTIDATISTELIGNVFYPKSPLHDGAAIVRNCKLYAAGCILPLTSQHDIASKFGTRHRAAIGMSEQSDAMVLVVSEETGEISMAQNGQFHIDLSDGEVRDLLLTFLSKPLPGGDKHGRQ